MKKRLLLGLIALIALLPLMAGTPAVATPHPRRTALQNHVDFFDRDGDGSITVSETHEGLVALKITGFRAWVLATAINAGLGRSTGAPWHDPLTVNADQIHLGKHGSDTGVYTTTGAFDQLEFDEIFTRHDANGDDALGESELAAFYARNKTDTVGSVASRAEFDLLMEVAGEERTVGGSFWLWWWQPERETVLTRARLQTFYDGTLFYVLAGEPVPAGLR